MPAAAENIQITRDRLLKFRLISKRCKGLADNILITGSLAVYSKPDGWKKHRPVVRQLKSPNIWPIDTPCLSWLILPPFWSHPLCERWFRKWKDWRSLRSAWRASRISLKTWTSWTDSNIWSSVTSAVLSRMLIGSTSNSIKFDHWRFWVASGRDRHSSLESQQFNQSADSSDSVRNLLSPSDRLHKRGDRTTGF